MEKTAANPDLRGKVIAILGSIAPEIEEAELRDDHPLRQQVDLDSMDWLNFLIGISEQLNVSIPEADYGRLVTLGDLLDYLRTKLG
ncbi:acyl carrier protein [Aromatoleum diolicum]|uniref:Acyl carrier protein n=1 Tax=Aromatoleum diolicum TaxID=75796 RepID=A0ABX1QCX3_9RHOO|nr:phosphopantetheine-binding protein [Aromatoleum diolicum]NMG74876.1 acyl carrier protein [Aromatoleum diolicum]